MIIANALKRLFTGLTADCTFLGTPKPNTPIQFWYGDQKELISWITQRKNLVNYPLIWYVLNEFTEFQGVYETNARLVIMQDTQLLPLNDWRNSNSYQNILFPIWEVIKDKLITNQQVEVMGDMQTMFKLNTIPNYGVEPISLTDSSKESINVDLVDCLVIDFKMRINVNCIN